MSSVHPSKALPETVDEETVRRLCGDAQFAEADTLQRDGHVLSPKLGEDGPEASVRGAWRRVDQVTVHIRAGRLLPACTRDGDVFCRHVGALLLQCLRDPDSLTAPKRPGEDAGSTAPSSHSAAISPNDTIETPAAELARLLDHDTATHLRQIARQRGVRLSGGKKADIVEQLTSALLEPASIDTAIAGLDQADRVALDATYLISAETPAFSEKIRDSMRVLGCSDDYSLDSLWESGLVVLASRQVYNDETYIVPRSVAARLPALGDLAQHVDVSSPNSSPGELSRFGIIETIQVIAQASLADHIETRQRTRQRDALRYAPPGFMFDPAEAGDIQRFSGPNTGGIHMVPLRTIADDDLAQLAERTGQSIATIDFVFRIMLALQVARATPEATIRFDRLQALLDMPHSVRLATLARAWLREAGPSVLDMLFGPGGPIELRWQPIVTTWFPPMQPIVASIGHLVAQLVSRMAEHTLYDLASFVDLVERLSSHAAPAIDQFRVTLTNARGLTMTSTAATGNQEPLALRPPEGWNRFLTALVTALLDGPLTWLGFVDVIAQPDRPRSFRVRPEAGVISDRFDTISDIRHQEPLVVSDDLTVVVPPNATDIRIHGLLSRAGLLVDASATGLRYRLTPAGAQALFDTGMTGPELTQLLTELAGGSIPKAARKELDRWWQDFGRVRLYDELTVIELSDDLLLPELLATTGLESAIVQTFSPRLIAIDATRAQDVIAELSDRGHTPRVIEER